MILYGLRLLVALLTFAVGVAAAWLFDFKSRAVFVEREVTTTSILVTERRFDVPPPPRSCSLERRSSVVQGGSLDFKAVSKPPAVYPPAAKALGIADTITVKVLVDEDGKVLAAEATGGNSLLRVAAEDAASGARFKPTLLAGRPARVEGYISYNFGLK